MAIHSLDHTNISLAKDPWYFEKGGKHKALEGWPHEEAWVIHENCLALINQVQHIQVQFHLEVPPI